jgi:hypothetical protein
MSIRLIILNNVKHFQYNDFETSTTNSVRVNYA